MNMEGSTVVIHIVSVNAWCSKASHPLWDMNTPNPSKLNDYKSGRAAHLSCSPSAYFCHKFIIYLWQFLIVQSVYSLIQALQGFYHFVKRR